MAGERIEQHLLYISSEDCKEIFSENTKDNFLIDLGKTYDFSVGIWFIELLEFRATVKTDLSSKNFYILSNICENSFVNEGYHPILRRIPNSVSKKTKKINIEFINPYPVKVIATDTNQINFSIFGDNFNSVIFDGKSLFLTIRLTKHGGL